jgi:hypothetical protein
MIQLVFLLVFALKIYFNPDENTEPNCRQGIKIETKREMAMAFTHRGTAMQILKTNATFCFRREETRQVRCI